MMEMEEQQRADDDRAAPLDQFFLEMLFHVMR